MNTNAADLKRVAPGLGVLLLLLAIGGALVWWSVDLANRAEREFQVSETRYQAASKRLREVNQEEALIRADAARYRQLVDRGIIGPEQRLAWIEVIGEVRKSNRLFELDYEFAPRRDLSGSVPPFRFSGSEMKLRLPLLHEEDLLRFLDGLVEKAPAHVRARLCSMERIAGSEGSALTPHLTGNCSLDWITIQNVSQNQDLRQ